MTIRFSHRLTPGGTLTIQPAAPISDNGTSASVAVQSAGTYTGGIAVNSAGEVTLTNLAPAGTHTITIRATDNCGGTRDARFTLIAVCR